jgi:hypothetical protein
LGGASNDAEQRMSSSYAGVPLPDAIATALARMLSLKAGSISTLGDLPDRLMPEHMPRNALVAEHPTRHEVRMAGRRLYAHCFLDALMLGYLDARGEAQIRSLSPLDEVSVRVWLSGDVVYVRPPEAVMSFGVGHGPFDATQTYLCPYISAFRDREEYERWCAAGRNLHTTIALPVLDAVALAHDIVLASKAEQHESRTNTSSARATK